MPLEDAPAPSHTRGWRPTLALGAALPAALYLVLTLGYDASYSHHLYARQPFLAQYEHGIYRYRVVGREAVVFVAKVLNHFHLVVVTPAVGRSDLFTALLVVNGAAFVAFTLLLYAATAREPGWLGPYVVLVVLVGASGYVVTPYDHLSYLLMLAAALVAFGPRPGPWWLCAVLGVVGVATRESFLVACAAAVGVAVASRGSDRRTTLLWRNALVLSGASVATYVGLKLALADPREASTFWFSSPFVWEYNRHLSSVAAVLIVVLGWWALHALFPRLDAGSRRRWRLARAVLWALSLPYLFACLVGGLWFESLRLLLPLFLAEYLVRASLTVSRTCTHEAVATHSVVDYEHRHASGGGPADGEVDPARR
jgi:hypothetical protein